MPASALTGQSTGSICDKVLLGLLSRPCARMGTNVLEFAFGVFMTLCVLLVIGMLWLGPQILEWIEDTPFERG